MLSDKRENSWHFPEGLSIHCLQVWPYVPKQALHREPHDRRVTRPILHPW